MEALKRKMESTEKKAQKAWAKILASEDEMSRLENKLTEEKSKYRDRKEAYSKAKFEADEAETAYSRKYHEMEAFFEGEEG